jgi:hypothetical protein
VYYQATTNLWYCEELHAPKDSTALPIGEGGTPVEAMMDMQKKIDEKYK